MLLSDFRYAFRSLARSPGFAATAVLTLALGIAANTAIYSVIDATLLRRLGLHEPERVLRLYGEDRSRNILQVGFSIPKFEAVRNEQQVFSHFGAALYGSAAVLGPEGAETLNGARITAGFFAALGAQPLLGRDLRRDEEENAPVLLISERLWRQRFEAAPDVIGRTLTVDGEALTIIGVMPALPPNWDGDLWLTRPFQLPGLSREVLMRGVSFLATVGRLRDGITADQARQNLKLIERNYRTGNPDKADSTWDIAAVDLREDLVGPLRPPMLTLLGAVGFVLLLACSNVANLLLVRFAGRHREIAVRSALGAARGRIVGQFLIEALVVSGLAAGLGALLAAWSLPALARLAAANLPFAPELSLNPTVLAGVLGVALLSGLLTGILPALHASRGDVAGVLRDGGRGTAGSRGQNRARRLLVAGQVALSLLLLAGASLLLSSFLKLQNQPLGFAPERTFVASVTLGGARYPDLPAQARLIERYLAELRTAAGVRSAAAVSSPPMTDANRAPYARADGEVPPFRDRPLGLVRGVSPGYFTTLGIPLVAGRDFEAGDTHERPRVIVISQAAARKLFPGEDPIGRRLLIGAQNGGLPAEIIGVAADVRSVSLASVPDFEMYTTVAQRPTALFRILVKVQGDPAAFAATARAVLRQIDPGLALNQPATLEAVIAQSLGQQRLLLTLLGGFGVLALALAAVGIYSVVAYTVTQRTPEIGVRAALGASPRQILAFTLRDGLQPVAWGIGCGLAAALAGGRLWQAQLYDTATWDPLALLGTCAVLGTVALGACLVPAWRAARVDPLVALRRE